MNSIALIDKWILNYSAPTPARRASIVVAVIHCPDCKNKNGRHCLPFCGLETFENRQPACPYLQKFSRLFSREAIRPEIIA